MSEYIIHKPTKSILLRPVHAGLVDSLPKARVAVFGDKKIVQVKHDEENTIALRAEGFDVPSPIKIYHEWTKLLSKHSPMSHQVETAEFITLNKKCFVGNATGTGKTASILWAFEYLKSIGKVDRLLIVCPISVIGVWENEVYQSFHKMNLSTLYGSKKQRLDTLSHDVDIFVINYDGLKVIDKELAEWNNDRTLWVADEAAKLTNAQTETYKKFYTLTKNIPRMILCTASPTSREPTQAWALIRMLNDRCPRYFGAFRDLVMRKVSTYKWLPKPDATAIVHKYLQPGIVFNKEDCLDLPPVVTEYLQVPLSQEQQDAYNEVKNEMVAELNSGAKITATNAAHKINMLRQICLGVVKVPEEDDVYEAIDAKPRIQAILDLIEGEPGKILICVPFKGAIKYYQKEIEKHHTCLTVNGDVKKKDRKEILDRFHLTNTLKVLLVHDAVASHGWNAQSCSHLVLTGPIYSSENALQLTGRIARAGQQNKMTVTKIYSTGMEKDIYERIEKKHDDLDYLLKLYKSVVGW